MTLSIRFAGPADAATVHRFITELAIYEREPDAVKVDIPTLERQMGEKSPPFEVLLAEQAGEAIGFALFFHSYSTWRGKRGIHLEDLFVTPKRRGQGAGKKLLAALAQLALSRDCARLEWWVLNWNQPAIDFYEAIDAKAQTEWTPYRLTDDPLKALASAFEPGLIAVE